MECAFRRNAVWVNVTVGKEEIDFHVHVIAWWITPVIDTVTHILRYLRLLPQWEICSVIMVYVGRPTSVLIQLSHIHKADKVKLLKIICYRKLIAQVLSFIEWTTVWLFHYSFTMKFHLLTQTNNKHYIYSIINLYLCFFTFTNIHFYNHKLLCTYSQHG